MAMAMNAIPTSFGRCWRTWPPRSRPTCDDPPNSLDRPRLDFLHALRCLLVASSPPIRAGIARIIISSPFLTCAHDQLLQVNQLR